MGKIGGFHYNGELPSSKSLYNRALIAQSFFKNFEIQGRSSCEDVVDLRKCLQDFNNGKNHFHCGSGGTTFRFLLARVSRRVGSYTFGGSKRLFERPHDELFRALESVGCEITKKTSTEIELVSKGWQLEAPLSMSLKTSSQYISALLLSAWDLEQELVVQLDKERNSFSYLKMTLDLLKMLGMEIEVNDNSLVVPAGQKNKMTSYVCEPDMSSAFTLAALALSSGEACFKNFPQSSLQPDFGFIKILQEMNADIKQETENSDLIVKKSDDLKPVQLDLKNNPDLFPVLSVLLSRVEGESELSNLDVLAYKESDRIQKVKELLTNLDISWLEEKNIFKIFGKKEHSYPESFAFDPDQDHRMVMAASLAKYQGARVDIHNPEVVSKSFPEFLKLVNL